MEIQASFDISSKISGMCLFELFGIGDMSKPITKWDGATPGLGVRINKSGASVWIGKFRLNGKQTLVTLGPVDSISYDQAKRLLKKAKSGYSVTCMSFEEFARHYLNHYSTKQKRTWDEERRRIARHLIPAFKGQALDSITSDQVRNLHCRLSEKTPREADQVLGLLRVIFNKAIDWEVLPPDFVKPFRGVEWNGRKERERFVTEAEMPKLMAVIHSLPRLEQRAIFLMYLLTGCRKMELVDLTWDEVEFQHSRIRLSAKRNKSQILVYKNLSAWAMAVLESLPKDQIYVFPGRYKNTRMKEVSSLWRKIRVEAGLEDVWLHDLRRTTGSWLAQSGESLHLIAQVLGQTTTYVTARYARFENKHIKDAVERHSEKLQKHMPDPTP